MELSKIPFTLANAGHNGVLDEIGWQSERFCDYPQDLELQLKHPHRILKIQILLHHFQIPSKIELAIEVNGAFQKLGFVSLSSNEKNEFKARELKTIHLDLSTSAVKISCLKCHINSLNLYNQVSIIAINLLGNPTESSTSTYIPVLPVASRNVISRSVDGSKTSEGIDQDQFVVRGMAAIAEAKRVAIEKEDYLLAKSLKALQLGFSEAVNELSSLQNEKNDALRLEDYDTVDATHKQILARKAELVLKLKDIKMDSEVEPKEVIQKFGEVRTTEAPRADEKTREESAVLSGLERQEYTLSIHVFGEQTIANILSPYFNLREEGLLKVDSFLQEKEGAEEVVRGAFQVISIIANDSREKAHGLMCALYTSVIAYCPDYSIMVETLGEGMPLLLNKAADMNPRVKKRSHDMIQLLCLKYPLLLSYITVPYTTKTVLWKYVKVRLEVCLEMVMQYGLSQAWTASDIIQFSIPFVSHTHVEVRSACITLLSYIISIDPSSRRELNKLPDSILNQITTKPRSTSSKSIALKMNEEVCIFCGVSDPSFTEETLDQHYWSSCPILTQCDHCHLLVEIPELTSHQITDCITSANNRECSKCLMVYSKGEKETHLSSEKCRARNRNVERCPICQLDCKNGLRNHLNNKPGCPYRRK